MEKRHATFKNRCSGLSYFTIIAANGLIQMMPSKWRKIHSNQKYCSQQYYPSKVKKKLKTFQVSKGRRSLLALDWLTKRQPSGLQVKEKGQKGVKNSHTKFSAHTATQASLILAHRF